MKKNKREKSKMKKSNTAKMRMRSWTSWEWKVMMKILPQLIDIPHPIFHMILQGMIITKFPSISLQSPHYICSFN
jgi:hypothetical protein